MHATVFQAFDEVCRKHGAAGHVLEVGATPTSDTLLMLPSLVSAQKRIGINLNGATDFCGCQILQGDAKDMLQFPHSSFDVVLCNAVLEHDGQFWQILTEMRRVARPGALMVIGVPGYADPLQSFWRIAARVGTSLPVCGVMLRAVVERWLASTPTLKVHEFPGDYYRFSEQACREVFMQGLRLLEARKLLTPPRFIVAGRVPVNAAVGQNQRHE
jgi:SAM-dependent methyltransferase